MTSSFKKSIFRHAIAAVIFWVVISLIFSTAQYLQTVRGGGTADYLSLLRSHFIFYGSTALLAPAIFAIGRRQAILKRSILRQAGTIIVAVIIIFSIHIVYSIFAIAPYLGVSPAKFFEQLWLVGWIWDLVLLAAILSVGYAYGYSEKIRDAKITQAELNSQLARIEAELANEQSSHLRQRLGSHFVLNALSNIIALVRKSESEKAMDGLYLLSEILRSIAHQNDDNLSTFDQELEFLEKYLKFQAIRYPALNIIWEIDASARQLLLPSHILQPLVENAFKHGMDASGSLELKISAQKSKHSFRLAVSNNLGKEPNLARRGEGQTLTELRLQKHYGADAPFTCTVEGNQYVAHIEIPMQKAVA